MRVRHPCGDASGFWGRRGCCFQPWERSEPDLKLWGQLQLLGSSCLPLPGDRAWREARSSSQLRWRRCGQQGPWDGLSSKHVFRPGLARSVPTCRGGLDWWDPSGELGHPGWESGAGMVEPGCCVKVGVGGKPAAFP